MDRGVPAPARSAIPIGAVFPQMEFEDDPAAIRDYAQAVEELGYSHVMAADHVLGAGPDAAGTLTSHTNESSFQEPLLLFTYMAAVTTALEFVTGVLVLPQRQTVLVAKQAAVLDVLCGGRLRLGVGVGWNAVEFEALGESFRTRGRRMTEQLEVLRLLWTDPLVTFEGEWHRISNAGLSPMPVQRPIPVWFGGSSEAAFRRAARFCSGWLHNAGTAEDARPLLELLDRLLAEEGRSRTGFGIEPRIRYGGGNEDAWIREIESWAEAGPTHFSVDTRGRGFTTAGEHIDALTRFAEAVL